MSEFSDWYSPDQWEPQESWLQEHEGAFNDSQTFTPAAQAQSNTTTPRASPVPTSVRPRRRKRRLPPQEKLPLLQQEEWDQARAYDEDPPTCVHYSIEWKVALNGKQISKDTEPNLVLTPASYWQLSLRSCLDQLAEKKMGHINGVKADKTSVVVSVTSRSEHDLTKRFEELDVNWTIVEAQLVQWSGLFRDGKKLRIDLTFHYVEANESATGGSASRAGIRGRPSATQRMLTNRNAQVQAEEETLGRASVWTEVYRQMRCPGSCPLGPHCWRDPRDKKHYKLYTHHLQRLVKYVQDGARLQSQDDVPENIRRELYAEAEDVSARKRTAKATLPVGLTPITINNHFRSKRI